MCERERAEERMCVVSLEEFLRSNLKDNIRGDVEIQPFVFADVHAWIHSHKLYIHTLS